jgi:hypothetical protein
MGSEGCLPGVKRLEHEADHPSPPSAMVMNKEIIRSLPVCAFMTWGVGTGHLFCFGIETLPGSLYVCMYKGWAIKLALAPRPLMIYCVSPLAAAMIITVTALCIVLAHGSKPT